MAKAAPSDVKDSVSVTGHVKAATPARALANVMPQLNKAWWQTPHLLWLNMTLIIPLLTSYVSGFDGSMMNGIQSVPVWINDFNEPSGATLGLLSNMQIIGGAIALPIAPWVSDKFGRRHPIFAGSIVLIVGAAIQGGANGIGMFIAGRGLVGFGGAFVATAASPLIAELAYPTQRPIITSIYNTSWYLGSIVAAWVTYGTFRMPNSWSWRIPSLLQALPSLIQLAFAYLIPESPRWLIANDQPDEAEKILVKYHAGGEMDTELVRWELAEIKLALQSEEEQASASYMHFLKTKGNRHRLFLAVILGFMIQWCGNGLITNYLVRVLRNIGIEDPGTQNLINSILQIVNYITALGSAFVVNQLGRRFMFLTSIAGMALAFVIWTAISAKNEEQNLKNKGLGIGIVIMIFVFFVFYNFAMNPVPTAYLLEYGSMLFNGFVNPVALDAIGWRYYIVFACLLGVWFAVVWFLFPETKGRSLEETAVLFDGEGGVSGKEVNAKANIDRVEA
ncbi:hypothetical protein BDW69DRAFT_190415 [Aspergillus filifer]